jgi:homoaconitate hydratase
MVKSVFLQLTGTSKEEWASSAVSGKIDYDWQNKNLSFKAEIKANTKSVADKPKVKILDGFPDLIKGDLIFCHQDNLNTDGIYPGKYTYIDDFTPEQQAGVVMENYDPEFSKIAKKGDIVAGGFNFGTGSSREQAATSLKYKGIACVIAGSLSETYKRNAINNGFLVIECPEIINELKKQFGAEKLTVATNKKIRIDFKNSSITSNEKEYSIDPVGEAAQELIITGGLENWVRKNLNK